MNKPSKRELKKQEILGQALKVWKDCKSQERSLSLLAEACGMTKQAFYRYFKSKQEILDTLLQGFQESVQEFFSRMLQLSVLSPLPLEQIADESLNFMIENKDSLIFSLQEGLSQHTDQMENSKNFYIQMGSESSLSSHDWVWLFNFLMVISWDNAFESRHHSTEWKKNIIFKVTNGFSSGVSLEIAVRKKIEQNPLGLRPLDLPTSRLSRAFLELVEEKGLSELSLKDLAEQAGMGKSSLYNYYESKEEMFRSFADHMREEFIKSRDVFLAELNTFPEKLYGHILFLSRYIDQIPAIRILMTEIKNNINFTQFHKKDKEFMGQKLSGLFQQGIDQSFLTEDPLSAAEQLEAISFCLGADFMILDDPMSPEDRAYHIFKLYTGGFNSGKEQK